MDIGAWQATVHGVTSGWLFEEGGGLCFPYCGERPDLGGGSDGGVSVFWWVELDFFSLECNEVSSSEF